MAQALAEIGAAFARLAGAPPSQSDYPQSTEPDYGALEVKYIVGQPKTGSKPPQGRNTGTPGWAEVFDAGLTTATDKWVQMHIISEKLGGKGVPENLIPAPNSINTGPFRSFEHLTAALARAKSGDMKNVVWAKFDVSRSGVYARFIRGQSGLYIWKGATASPKWVKGERYSFFAQAMIPAPDLSKGAQVFSLNFSSGTDLAKLQLDPKLIELIKTGRLYPSLAIFVRRMEERAAAAGIPNYKAKIASIVGNPKVVLNEPAPPS